MADCKKWGDDTAGAQEEKHTYGKWNLMVSGDEMRWEKKETQGKSQQWLESNVFTASALYLFS